MIIALSPRRPVHAQEQHRAVAFNRTDELAALTLPSREEFRKIGDILGLTAPTLKIPQDASLDRKIDGWLETTWQRLMNAKSIINGIGTGLFGAGALYRVSVGDLQTAHAAGTISAFFALTGVIWVIFARHCRVLRERTAEQAISELARSRQVDKTAKIQ